MKIKYTILILSILLIGAFLFRFVCYGIKLFNEIGQSQIFGKGQKLNVDSISVYDLKGKKDTVITFRGIKVLNFWASWCKPCPEEMKSLQQLQQLYPAISVNLISFEDTFSQQKAIKAQAITLPAFVITDTTVFNKPAILPRTIVLKNNVVIRDMFTARVWTSKEFTDMMDTLIIINK